MTTWNPDATRRTGPAAKTGYPFDTTNEALGAVVHSAEGYFGPAMDILDGPKPVSWHFFVTGHGQLFQHYPLEAVTWHAGLEANLRYVGIECEGVAGSPLGDSQLRALQALLLWLKATRGWPSLSRGVTLFEHNEFMATACPSGRIPWGDLAEAKPAPATFKPGELDYLRALISAGQFVRLGYDLRNLHPLDKVSLRRIAELAG
ncbi:MAG TPA: peptidoglycan recognition family protein [Dehalococcoidia bacterium]